MGRPFDDETRVDRFDDETRTEGAGGKKALAYRRLYAAVDGQLVTFPVPEERHQLVVGRSSDADVTLDHPSISRRHLMLRLGPPLALKDQGSSNGTWVRGVRVKKDESMVIKPGEVFRVGDASVWIESKRHVGVPETPPEPDAASATVAASPVVEDEAMKSLYELVSRVAHGSINVLLLGETGVGKEVVARAVHFRSNRNGRAFVALNCAAFSETLLESELFGHERGAFTGANAAKPGLLETADGGTVLLDEVGELSLASQAKLLRALEEKRVFRLGSLKARPVDVRFVSATNRNLAHEVEVGRFRRDLYYRLNGVTLDIPPLRDRPSEVAPLARRYVRVFAARLGRSVPELQPESLAALSAHTWPGNIRELRNVIERAVLLCADAPIGPEHLRLTNDEPAKSSRAAAETDPHGPESRPDDTERFPLPEPTAEPASLKSEMATLEREKILAALDECGGNQTRAAKLLGMSRNTLIRKLDRYGIPRPRKRP